MKFSNTLSCKVERLVERLLWASGDQAGEEQEARVAEERIVGDGEEVGQATEGEDCKPS